MNYYIFKNSTFDLDETMFSADIMNKKAPNFFKTKFYFIEIGDDYKKQSLLTTLTQIRDKARMGSLGLPHTGDWLNVVPSPTLGLHLRPSEFRYSVLYRLGAPLFQSEGPCTACSAPSDRYGDHAISCGMAGERIARHNHLRDTVFNTAASANLAPLREERALLPGTEARPADVLIPHWTAGKDTAMDVTVINPLRLDLAVRSATEPGFALDHVYRAKWNKHGPPCEAQGMVFTPIPVDTFGAFHEVAIANLRKLGQCLARATAEEESISVNHFFQRLSVTLMKGNASLLLNRIPTNVDPSIDGHY
jgi:hypothetical protein